MDRSQNKSINHHDNHINLGLEGVNNQKKGMMEEEKEAHGSMIVGDNIPGLYVHGGRG